MLVLERKIDQRIFIGDNIVITLVKTHRDGAKIGIDAPEGILVDREEIRQRRLRDANKTLETDAETR